MKYTQTSQKGKLPGPALGITSRQGRLSGRGGAWPFKGPSQLVLSLSSGRLLLQLKALQPLSSLIPPQSQLVALEWDQEGSEGQVLSSPLPHVAFISQSGRTGSASLQLSGLLLQPTP